MLDTSVRLAASFAPAGVPIIVGIVLAIRRRRVAPALARLALIALVLHLLVAVLATGPLLVPVLSRSGWTVAQVLTLSSVLGLVLIVLTAVAWILLLAALFTRLPAADAATTGRHVLLDAQGSPVVAQEGRAPLALPAAPSSAAAGGVALGGAAVWGATQYAGSDAPTETVPVAGHDDEDDDIVDAEVVEPLGSDGRTEGDDDGAGGPAAAATGLTGVGGADTATSAMSVSDADVGSDDDPAGDADDPIPTAAATEPDATPTGAAEPHAATSDTGASPADDTGPDGPVDAAPADEETTDEELTPAAGGGSAGEAAGPGDGGVPEADEPGEAEPDAGADPTEADPATSATGAQAAEPDDTGGTQDDDERAAERPIVPDAAVPPADPWPNAFAAPAEEPEPPAGPRAPDDRATGWFEPATGPAEDSGFGPPPRAPRDPERDEPQR